MPTACVLLAASWPDPTTRKAALAPFHAARDGHATTSVSGFVLLHGQQPVVVTSAAVVLPLLQQQRRQGPHAGLPGATHADLVAGTQLTALRCPAGLPDGSSCSASSPSPQQPVQLRLVGVAELPGVRHALRQLLSAPSTAGPGGWSLGWLLHRGSTEHQQQQAAQLASPPWHGSTGSGAGGGGISSSSPSFPAAAPSPAMLLEAACHAAVLVPTTAEGAAALAGVVQPWPDSRSGAAAVRHGQPLAAVGAPFGALSPLHFGGFVAGGVVAAAVPAASDVSSTGSGKAALLLSDVRCSPGMEGGPVFALSGMPPAAAQAAAAQQQQEQQEQRLAGMLLPPLKSAAAQVELALLAPAAAVAAAVDTALLTSGGSARQIATAAAAPPQARMADTAGAGPALQGVVAVASSSGWASGVVVSSAGHILTNAHLLEPPARAAQHGLLPAPDAASAAAAAAAGNGAVAAAAAAHPPVRVLLPGSKGSWDLADVLYVFSGPLDLAVLQLQQPAQQQQQPEQQPAWRPLVLAGGPPRPGQRVCVAGFPAFHPRGGVLGPLVTAGTLAKVVRTPTGAHPAMLLTTAAVHSGASGGAVVDAHSGGWLGLVTSNAKHSGAQRGTQQQATVLPHLNFSLPALQLQPVVAAAQAAAAAPPGDQCAAAAAALAAWQALDSATAADEELQRVWRLDRQRQRQQPADKQQQQGGSPGAFGGAAPPAKLQQLLRDLQHKQQREPGGLPSGQPRQPRAKL